MIEQELEGKEEHEKVAWLQGWAVRFQIVTFFGAIVIAIIGGTFAAGKMYSNMVAEQTRGHQDNVRQDTSIVWINASVTALQAAKQQDAAWNYNQSDSIKRLWKATHQ
jgi:hypothetical protein